MNILIAGCGKVGARLAGALFDMGHEVSVIDRDPESFQLLGDGFGGLTVAGIPIDQEVLVQAGIEGCDAVAAMTSSDNINAMTCQIAREVFGVGQALARIYDPRQEPVLARFGMRTVCPTNLTVDAAVSMLTSREEVQYLTMGASTLAFSTERVPRRYNGYHVGRVPAGEGERVVGVMHADGRISLTAGDGDFIVYDTDRLLLCKVAAAGG